MATLRDLMHDPSAEELRLPRATEAELRAGVEAALADRAHLPERARSVREVIFRLDRGTLRVAEKGPQGWTVHGWVQQAINLFFSLAQSEQLSAGDLKFFDKIPPKQQPVRADALHSLRRRVAGRLLV
jgi:tetrahydrodipicolinate N-succinyltransferase